MATISFVTRTEHTVSGTVRVCMRVRERGSAGVWVVFFFFFFFFFFFWGGGGWRAYTNKEVEGVIRI